MPTIHGAGLSPFVRKVRIALVEKGVDYQLNPVMPFGQSDEFMAMSPLGKIPVYQEGEFAVPDSSVILAYLERAHPHPALYPEDPKEYARALWFEEYADTKLVETVGPVFFQRLVGPMMLKQETDEALVSKHLNELAPPVFDYLERELGDREVLVGASFSVADIATFSPFVNLGHAGESVDASRWPRLAAYLERIASRPSCKALIEEEKAGLPG